MHYTISAYCIIVYGTVCRGWCDGISRGRCKKLQYIDDIRRVYAVYTDFSAGNGVKSYKPIEF